MPESQELLQMQCDAECATTAGMCVCMLEWAKKATQHLTSADLLELYCGNGNFTVALAENFR